MSNALGIYERTHDIGIQSTGDIITVIQTAITERHCPTPNMEYFQIDFYILMLH